MTIMTKACAFAPRGSVLSAHHYCRGYDLEIAQDWTRFIWPRLVKVPCNCPCHKQNEEGIPNNGR